MLHDTIERIHMGKEYGDIPRGILLVRGENVVLIGEIVCRGDGACLCGWWVTIAPCSLSRW